MKPLNVDLWNEKGDVTTQGTVEISSFCSSSGGGCISVIFLPCGY